MSAKIQKKQGYYSTKQDFYFYFIKIHLKKTGTTTLDTIEKKIRDDFDHSI